MGPEVTLPRSHLVEVASGELVEADKRVGLQRGAVWVPGRVWRSIVPFFHEEVLAYKLKLRVGAARGGLTVLINEEVLGGDWEGGMAVGAEKEKH